MEALEKAIGYTFREPRWLEEALTHPSLGKTKHKNPFNNQRLEFLGDSVLGMVIAEMLFAMYEGDAEGALAKRQAALVRSETLARVAQTIGIAGYLKLSASEAASGGRENPATLEDAVEALIGALYLDGGIDVARAFIERHWKAFAASVKAPPKDAKSALQEWAQGRGLQLPKYTVVESIGPAHAPEFTVEVSIEAHPSASASAPSKRAAEQKAAAELLKGLPE